MHCTSFDVTANVSVERQLRRTTVCGSKPSSGSTVRSNNLLCASLPYVRIPARVKHGQDDDSISPDSIVDAEGEAARN